jgi:hypothetical protein
MYRCGEKRQMDSKIDEGQTDNENRQMKRNKDKMY